MENKVVEVAIAIIPYQDKFLMQLRDDIPSILYPGCWGFFGGHIDPGETPEVAIKRELREEINFNPAQVFEFGCYSDSRVIRHVFHTPLTVEPAQLVLKEGWDFGFVAPEDIKNGECYSEKAGLRPLGVPHQTILLDFMNKP